MNNNKNLNLLCEIKTLCGENINFFYKIKDKNILYLEFESNGARIFSLAGDFICKIINDEKINFYDIDHFQEYFWNNFEIRLIGERKVSINNILIEVHLNIKNIF